MYDENEDMIKEEYYEIKQLEPFHYSIFYTAVLPFEPKIIIDVTVFLNPGDENEYFFDTRPFFIVTGKKPILLNKGYLNGTTQKFSGLTPDMYNIKYIK